MSADNTNNKQKEENRKKILATWSWSYLRHFCLYFLFQQCFWIDECVAVMRSRYKHRLFALIMWFSRLFVFSQVSATIILGYEVSIYSFFFFLLVRCTCQLTTQHMRSSRKLMSRIIKRQTIRIWICFHYFFFLFIFTYLRKLFDANNNDKNNKNAFD